MIHHRTFKLSSIRPGLLQGNLSPHLLARLLVLPEQVVKDGPVLFVDPLHLVDVLGHSLHPDQGFNQMLLLVRVW